MDYPNPFTEKHCRVCKSRRPPSWKCVCCGAKSAANKMCCMVCFTYKDDSDVILKAVQVKEAEAKALLEIEDLAKREAEKAKADLEEKKANFTENSGTFKGRFRHPGSFDGCGGNPFGFVASSKGGGVCGDNCSDCGKGTHWVCACMLSASFVPP